MSEARTHRVLDRSRRLPEFLMSVLLAVLVWVEGEAQTSGHRPSAGASPRTPLAAGRTLRSALRTPLARGQAAPGPLPSNTRCKQKLMSRGSAQERPSA